MITKVVERTKDRRRMTQDMGSEDSRAATLEIPPSII